MVASPCFAICGRITKARRFRVALVAVRYAATTHGRILRGAHCLDIALSQRALLLILGGFWDAIRLSHTRIGVLFAVAAERHPLHGAHCDILAGPSLVALRVIEPVAVRLALISVRFAAGTAHGIPLQSAHAAWIGMAGTVLTAGQLMVIQIALSHASVAILPLALSARIAAHRVIHPRTETRLLLLADAALTFEVYKFVAITAGLARIRVRLAVTAKRIVFARTATNIILSVRTFASITGFGRIWKSDIVTCKFYSRAQKLCGSELR